MAISAGSTILASDIQAIKDDVDAILSGSRAVIATSESTTNTSFTALSTAGPSVTLTTGTMALVIVTARCLNDTAGGFCHMSWQVSGASSIAASDATAFTYESSSAGDQMRASAVHLTAGLTAGSNTFTAQYRVNTGTGTWSNRALIVIPLGD